MPKLTVTGDDAADRLVSEEPLALLLAMLLDQQVPMEWAFRGPSTLATRLDGPLQASTLAALEPDELVTGITFPDWPKGHITLFRELAQRPGDFALVGLVGALTIEGGRIARAGIAWFGMGPTPIRATAAEQMLLGQSPDAIDPMAAAERAIADTAAFDDHHTSAEYRRTVGKRLFARTLRDSLKIGEPA